MPWRRLQYAAAWLVAASLAVAVGIAAVSSVGASIEGRGPIGQAVVRDIGRGAVPSVDPEARLYRDTVTDVFGEFRVGCRGVVAYGFGVDPAPSWRIVSFEEGPDDDVDAVFTQPGRSVEVEVYCNQGVPTVGDVERATFIDED